MRNSIAYAAVAELPLAVGLYTAFVSMIVHAFMGTSRSATSHVSAAEELASYCGLVPRVFSSARKTHLGGTSRFVNLYLKWIRS